jgi:DNA (cytosine-5)-methyltransferase 1
MGKRHHAFSLTEAAKLIGVAPITLKRWLLAGKVAEVERDRNDWRVFTALDIQRIKRFASKRTRPRANDRSQ